MNNDSELPKSRPEDDLLDSIGNVLSELTISINGLALSVGALAAALKSRNRE
jgi:hypothetical protein